MVEQFVNTVLFAGFRDFFQLGSTCGALHLAIYSPIENDTIQPSICTVLLCGWCSTTPLRNTMWNTQPVAECQTCGLRFPRSIGASNVGPMFVMASSIKLLEQYNKVHPCRLRYLRRPDPWQSVDDLEYDAATNRVSFLVNTQRVSVVTRAPTAGRTCRARREEGRGCPRRDPTRTTTTPQRNPT